MKLTKLVLLLPLALYALAADVTGKWTASFDTAIGMQNYTYDFKVDNGKLTGHAKSNLGEGDLSEGKVDGDNITFVESLKYQDNVIRVEYKGKIAGDEIRFTRQVGEFATEELVAKRAK